jgi:hypothetical protein
MSDVTPAVRSTTETMSPTDTAARYAGDTQAAGGWTQRNVGSNT